jgi:transposase
MNQIRNVVKQCLTGCLSHRSISLATGVSRPVVGEYAKLAKSNQLTMEELERLSDAELNARLGLSPEATLSDPKREALLGWLLKSESQIGKKGRTRRFLHADYIAGNPDGYQYSQFCLHIQEMSQSRGLSGLLDHSPGEKCYTDFAGDKFHWLEPDGTEHVEEVFIGILGASQLTYADLALSQRVEDWLAQHVGMFAYFGGSTAITVCDCLKTGVTKTDGYEAVIQREYQLLAEHYGTVILPARPRHPKDKPLVENAVQQIYRTVYAPLDGKTFPDREAARAAVRSHLDALNLKAFSRHAGSRRSRFEELESSSLRPLPTEPFSHQRCSVQTVPNTGMVYIGQDKVSYSVPYRLVGKAVEVILSTDAVEVWHAHVRQACHIRQRHGALHVLKEEHLAPDIKWYRNWDDEHFLAWAKLAGPHVLSFCHGVIARAEVPEKGWRVMMGLMDTERRFPGRLDMSCRLAQRDEDYQLAGIKAILKNEEDLKVSATEAEIPELPWHGNIRGSAEVTV